MQVEMMNRIVCLGQLQHAPRSPCRRLSIRSRLQPSVCFTISTADTRSRGDVLFGPHLLISGTCLNRLQE
jgi:hypothetical protein